MLDTRARYIFQPIFNLLGRTFVFCGIKPNTITGAAFLSGVFAGVLVGFNKPYLGLACLWFSGLLDVLDGTVARLSGATSKAGAYMDLILDRMVEAAFILGFTFLYPQYYLSYIIFFVSVIFNFSTFMVAGSLFENTGNKSMYYDIGIVERTETFIAFSLMVLLQNYVFYILMLLNILIFATGIMRFAKVLKYASHETDC